MCREKKRRIHFSLYWRIRDHGDCRMYEQCLRVAAKHNAPRVCWEKCPLYVKPKKCKAREIAEILEGLRDNIQFEEVDTDSQKLDGAEDSSEE